MTLADFVNFSYSKQEEFHKAIKKEGRKITLREITQQEVGEETIQNLMYLSLQKDCIRFERGSSLKFIIQGLELYLNPNELNLSICNTKIKSFKGARVKAYYNQIAERIEQALENEDVPF
jgi:hypothetical protein